MGPFRTRTPVMAAPMEQTTFSSSASQMGLEVPLMERQKQSAWQARRKRKQQKRQKEEQEHARQRFQRQQQEQNYYSKSSPSSPPVSKTKQNPDTPETVPDDEAGDPYESDPGESYREHCERMEAESFPQSRSCLTVPKFLRKSKSEPVRTRAATLLDEDVQRMDHADNLNPQSLPKDSQQLKYSKQSEIGDGSQPQDWSDISRPLRPNRTHLNISHWSDFGKRGYMEDRYAIQNLGAVQVEVSPIHINSNSQDQQHEMAQRTSRRLKMPLTWVGIFDGHGGEKASQFCSDWLAKYVQNEDSYPFDLGLAMKNAFVSIDRDFLHTGHPDGSTACAATLVGGRRIVCANAGDSRAIVVRKDGSVVRLSRDHKPGVPDETKRITDMGGRVIYWGRWRVEGLLAVSRSVGDASLKPYVSAEPEVCEYDIGKDDWFLVMSSDGVWDVMDNEEAAHVVIASSCVMQDGRLKIDTRRFQFAARNLIEHAKSCGSLDNFSAIVVDLKSCGNPSSKSGTYEP